MEHLGAIEKRLWSSADNLRANSNFASNEYFLPVMGLIFLRHAYSRFLKVKAEIEPSLPDARRHATRTHQGGFLPEGCDLPASGRAIRPSRLPALTALIARR